MMFSTFSHVVAYINTSFLFVVKKYSVESISCILFIHLSVDEHLCLFLFLTIVSNAARNICVQLFCVDICFYFSRIYTSGWNCWILQQLCLTSGCQAVSYSSCTVLLSSSIWSFQLLHFFTNTHCLFDSSHANECVVAFHCDFDLHLQKNRVF